MTNRNLSYSEDKVKIEKLTGSGFGKMYYSQKRFLIARCSKNIKFLKRVDQCHEKDDVNHVHEGWEIYD